LAVGKKLGTSKGYLSGIENEKVNPPMDRKIRRLAKILGMDEMSLLRAAWLDRMPPDVRKMFGGE
jgi:transcriptional regulator with XRE-family HTH domain